MTVDYRAIAAVTAALRELLQEAASDAVAGATVTVERPSSGRDAASSQAGVNLFLFRASVDPHFRNADVPTRTRRGKLLQVPRIGIELDYLLTFHGEGLSPHRLLGRAVARLHESPVLTKARVRSAVANAEGGVLDGCGLDEQLPLVRMSPVPLSLDELARLWSTFGAVPYDVSVTYRASTVWIDVSDADVVLERAEELVFDVARHEPPDPDDPDDGGDEVRE